MHPVSRSEGFSFDPLNQAVRWGGRTITLTPKAAAILSCLIENTGNLVTHEQLLDEVWPKTFIHPEAIKVYIFELRRALGDTAKNPDPSRRLRAGAIVSGFLLTRSSPPRQAKRPRPAAVRTPG